jgi:hypothetical protein
MARLIGLSSKPGAAGWSPWWCLPTRPGRRPCPPRCSVPAYRHRTHLANTGPRRCPPNPARPGRPARALALAICEVEAGLRSASQLERICHPSLWEAVADRVQRTGGPPVSGSSVLRVQVQEDTPGLVDAVAVVRRGQRAVFITLRLEAVPGHWELAVTAIAPAGMSRSCGCPPARVGGGRGPRPGLGASREHRPDAGRRRGDAPRGVGRPPGENEGAYSAVGVTPHPPWHSYRPLAMAGRPFPEALVAECLAVTAGQPAAFLRKRVACRYQP